MNRNDDTSGNNPELERKTNTTPRSTPTRDLNAGSKPNSRSGSRRNSVQSLTGSGLGSRRSSFTSDLVRELISPKSTPRRSPTDGIIEENSEEIEESKIQTALFVPNDLIPKLQLSPGSGSSGFCSREGYEEQLEELDLNNNSEVQAIVYNLDVPTTKRQLPALPATRIPAEFLIRLLNSQIRCGNLLSFRAEKPFESKRRISLADFFPKMNETSSKTGIGIRLGHITDISLFIDEQRPYKLKDNNSPGSLPLDLQGQSPNPWLQREMRKKYADNNDNPTLSAIFDHNNLYYLSKRVEKYRKQEDGTWLGTNEFHDKHYVQEAHTINYIIKQIESGVFTVGSAITTSNSKLYFTVQEPNIVECMLDLSRGSKVDEHGSITKVNIKNSKDIAAAQHEDISDLLEIIRENLRDNLDTHFPVFYKHEQTHEFVPFYVLTGRRNGAAITTDLDSEHNSMRWDMPWFAAVSFNGSNKYAVQKFLLGLILLEFRLELRQNNDKCFEELLSSLINAKGNDSVIELDAIDYENLTLEHKIELARKLRNQICGDEEVEYNEILGLLLEDVRAWQADISKRYDYTTVDFYQETFIPLLRLAFNHYSKNPEELKDAGQSSLNDIVLRPDLGSPLYSHGADDKNPSSELEEMGQTLIYYNQLSYMPRDNPYLFLCAPNTISYIAFLLSSTNILNDQFIDVHPSRLDENNEYHQYWRDIIRIQALHRKLRDLRQDTDFFFNNFRNGILQNINFRTCYGSKYDAKLDAVTNALELIFADIDNNCKAYANNKERRKFIKEQLNILYNETYHEIRQDFRKSVLYAIYNSPERNHVKSLQRRASNSFGVYSPAPEMTTLQLLTQADTIIQTLSLEKKPPICPGFDYYKENNNGDRLEMLEHGLANDELGLITKLKY